MLISKGCSLRVPEQLVFHQMQLAIIPYRVRASMERFSYVILSVFKLLVDFKWFYADKSYQGRAVE